MNLNNSLRHSDPDLFNAMSQEDVRQEDHIELIASENYASKAVMEAQGSQLTNKYAEGYPGKRYYGGCEYVDQVEVLAIERAKQLFGADYVNVQPHSGSQANSAVFAALLSPGDKVLGMGLDHGGHLTHGSSVNFSGKTYDSISYGVEPDTGLVNYDEIKQLAIENKPKMIIAGFSAYSGTLDWAKFREIADLVGAYLFVDMAHIAGLVVAGICDNPIKYADVVTSTTHKTLAGPRGGIILAKSNPEIEKKLNSAVFPGNQGGPLMHIIAAKAVAFKEALQPEFIEYQKQVVANAKAMAQIFKLRGINIVSDDTTNHLLLVDLRGTEVTGKEAETYLGQANITVNKNSVPNDPASPFVTSGIRIGTPAMTRRGMMEAEATLIAHWVSDIILSKGDSNTIKSIKGKVVEICSEHPVYK